MLFFLHWEDERDNGCPCPRGAARDQMVMHVGRTMFETDALPTDLARFVNGVDEVGVEQKGAAFRAIEP